MKTKLLLFVFFIASMISAQVKVELINKTNISRFDECVCLPLSKIAEREKSFSLSAFQLFDGDKELAYQIIAENIIFVIDVPAKSRKEIIIKSYKGTEPIQYNNRTYAEISPKKGGVYFDGKFRGPQFESVKRYKVPAIHKDHDALFKYEGPGWESELVGYRFYLDWRNATDVFGKKIYKLLLKDVGVHDTVANDDSYHKMQDWGMDIFKVGSSLGIGSIGMWADGKVNMVSKTDSVISQINENGPIRSTIETNYYGWLVDGKKYDLNAKLSINAGSRLTKCDLLIEDAENIATGLAKYEGTSFVKSNNKGDWQYISLFGKQSLNNDNMGIALFYNKYALIELTEDNLSYIVKLKPNNGKVTYFFAAAWELEPKPITTEKEFINYLDDQVNSLNNPITVEIKD
ncbi:hypothetical protein APF79_00990 [bacterium BRH_c32]|nr:MAG: hypothetical protein APF79_00990 [bacterium BRH_c32]